MLNEETKRKLRLLNLASIIDIIEQQDSDVQTVVLPFDQRFQRKFREQKNAITAK